MNIDIKLDDVSTPDVIELLESHLTAMQAQTPPESVHALDLSSYRLANIKLWTAWSGTQLLGCGALKDLGSHNDERVGEIKSMRTKTEFVRMGVGDAIIAIILDYAKTNGMQRLSLETGVTEHFHAAHQFYTRHGFTKTTPFSDYTNDPHSVFYTIELNA